mmetsp:Transcript_28788/g.71010  ORF Transcript_28788/g.71010 Transcript_28788/m.71010 type:complete len:235 (-) Transcript_28788:184-888(-)
MRFGAALYKAHLKLLLLRLLAGLLGRLGLLLRLGLLRLGLLRLLLDLLLGLLGGLLGRGLSRLGRLGNLGLDVSLNLPNLGVGGVGVVLGLAGGLLVGAPVAQAGGQQVLGVAAVQRPALNGAGQLVVAVLDDAQAVGVDLLVVVLAHAALLADGLLEVEAAQVGVLASELERHRHLALLRHAHPVALLIVVALHLVAHALQGGHHLVVAHLQQVLLGALGALAPGRVLDDLRA